VAPDVRKTLLAACAVGAGATLLLWAVHGFFDPSRLHVWGRFVDQAGYVTTARHLAETGELRSGLVYPSFLDDPRWRPYLPGHYVALALSYSVLGYSAFASLLPNLIAFVVVAVGTFLIARRVGGSIRTGLVATVLFAFFPSFLLYAFSAMAELTFTAAGVGALAIFLHLPERWRAAATPLLVALPFLFRETGALLVLPMAAFLAFPEGGDGRPRWRRAGLALAGTAVLLGSLNAWQIADGKGDAPLNWVLEGSFNYADATAEPPEPLSPLGWVRAVATNVGRNVAELWNQARIDLFDVRVPGALWIALLLAINVFVARKEGRRNPMALGAAAAGAVLYVLIFGLYDVKSEKLLRSSMFLYPLVLPAAVAFAAGNLSRRSRRLGVGALVLAAAGGLWVARDLGRAFRAEDAAVDLLTQRIHAMGPPPDRLLVGHFPTTLNYAVQHYPTRWAFLPQNEETLELLNERYPVGMVVLPERSMAKRFPRETLEGLGLRQKPRVIQSLGQGTQYHVWAWAGE